MGNSADSAEARACLHHVRVEECRVVGVMVRQARPMLASVLPALFGTCDAARKGKAVSQALAGTAMDPSWM